MLYGAYYHIKIKTALSVCFCQNKLCEKGILSPDCDWYQRADGQYSWVYKDKYDGQDGPAVDSENNPKGKEWYFSLKSNYFLRARI